jgi:hypothetical protein
MPKQMPNSDPGLPGIPVFDTGDSIKIIKSSRIIRDRDGKPIFMSDHSDTRFVIEAAGEFLGRDIRRVFFLSKKGERQQPVALANGPDTGDRMLSSAECLVIEAFKWIRTRERKKRIRLTASAVHGGKDVQRYYS